MRDTIFVILLIASSQYTLGSYQYFKFKPENVKISKESYRRYIKPQAKNISTEFYFLAKNVTPAVEPINHFRKKVVTLISSVQDLSNCKSSESCHEQQLKVLSKLGNETHNLFKINQNIFSESKLKSDKYDNYLNLLEQSRNVRQILFKLESKIQLSYLLLNTNFEANSPSLKEVQIELTQLENIINQMVVELLPSQYKGIFDELLHHFIIPLEKRVIQKSSSEWLVNNLGRLNLAWNTFHMSLDKGGLNFPKKHVNLLKIMHNRWNSILKIIF